LQHTSKTLPEIARHKKICQLVEDFVSSRLLKHFVDCRAYRINTLTPLDKVKINKREDVNMIQFNFAVGCSDSGQTELPVPVIVAFAPTTKDGFQNLDEKP